MTAPVFISPLGYPLGRAPRYCRLAVIGLDRHATACLASIPADEPVLITARRPFDQHLCVACLADLRVREQRGDDLTPWRGQIGAPALLTVERAAEELFGAAVSRTATADLPKLSAAVEEWDDWHAASNADADEAPGSEGT